ncbi:MAG: DUF4870 domain-containing protein [Propionibacteriaceae bacterium]
MPEFPLYEPHPTLELQVNDEQRKRAKAWLENVRDQGRIDDIELTHRLDIVSKASNRGELNAAFLGLVHRPAAVASHPVVLQSAMTKRQDRGGRAAAAFAHYSFFFSWLLGPALVFFTSRPGSYSRREAAKAFNFYFVSHLLGLACLWITDCLPSDSYNYNSMGSLFMSVSVIIFLVLSFIGTFKAAQGEDWRNPVSYVLRLQVLNEGVPLVSPKI